MKYYSPGLYLTSQHIRTRFLCFAIIAYPHTESLAYGLLTLFVFLVCGSNVFLLYGSSPHHRSGNATNLPVLQSEAKQGKLGVEEMACHTIASQANQNNQER